MNTTAVTKNGKKLVLLVLTPASSGGEGTLVSGSTVSFYLEFELTANTTFR